LINPNLQAGVSGAIDPELYNQGIVRVCATSSPGQGTEPGRWTPVGTCDSGRGDINCYLDTKSVKDIIKTTSIEDEALKTAGSKLEEELKKSGILTESQFDKLIAELNILRNSKSYQIIISKITDDIIKKAFFNFQKAKLYLFRGDAHGGLAGEGKVAEKKTSTPSGAPSTSGTGSEAVEPVTIRSKVDSVTILTSGNDGTIWINDKPNKIINKGEKLVVNIENGAEVRDVGKDMNGGEINIHKGAKVTGLVGFGMTDGKIFVYQGAEFSFGITGTTIISDEEDLKNLEGALSPLDVGVVEKRLVVFVSEAASLIEQGGTP